MKNGRLTERDAVILEVLFAHGTRMTPGAFGVLQEAPAFGGTTPSALRGIRNRLVGRGLVDRRQLYPDAGNDGWRYIITNAGIEALEKHYDT